MSKTIRKTIRFPKEIHDKITELGKEQDRNFSNMVLVMAKKVLMNPDFILNLRLTGYEDPKRP